MDSAADYIFQAERADLSYPPPFGRDATAEEAKIMEMDSKTGASLKVSHSIKSNISMSAPKCFIAKLFCLYCTNHK